MTDAASSSSSIVSRAEDREEVHQLREKIEDIIFQFPKFNEGFYLLTFLKVRKFNVRKAEDFIREVAKWRKDNEAEKAIKADYHPEISQCFYFHMDGLTKTGLPVYSSHAGVFQFRETIAKYGKETVIYYWLQLLAKAENKILARTATAIQNFKNTDEGIDFCMLPHRRKCWLIMDMTGFQFHVLLSKDTISVFLALAKMSVSYFPALEGVLCFINAGKVLEIFFKLLRPVLHGSNVEMLVYGYDQEEWKAAIHEHIDPSQLRPGFGGTMTAPAVNMCTSSE